MLASAGRWELSTVQMFNYRVKSGMSKHSGTPDCSKQQGAYVVEDQDHPQMIEIHVQPKRMPRKMEGAGCVRESKLVVDNVDKEEAVFHLCSNNK
jgi:hypothetical protein